MEIKNGNYLVEKRAPVGFSKGDLFLGEELKFPAFSLDTVTVKFW